MSEFDALMPDIEWFEDDTLCNQAMDEFQQGLCGDQCGFVDLYGLDQEEDEDCCQAMDRFERNRKFQSHLISQSAGAIDPNARGEFIFI